MSDCQPRIPSNLRAMFPDTTPEDRVHECCPDISWQSSPLAITSTIAKSLEEYFSNPSNFTNKELRNMLSDAAPVITQMDSVNYKETGKLPRISVEFEGSQIGELEFAGHNSLGYNMHNSQEEFLIVWNIHHKVEIVAQTKREAILLGEEACKLFAHYKKAFLRMLQAHKFNMTQLTGAKSVSEDDSSKGYIASISLLTVTPDRWFVAQSAPRFKKGVTEFVNS